MDHGRPRGSPRCIIASCLGGWLGFGDRKPWLMDERRMPSFSTRALMLTCTPFEAVLVLTLGYVGFSLSMWVLVLSLLGRY